MKNINSNVNHINEKNRLFELSANITIRKTYLLLSLCFFLSVISASIGIITNYKVNFFIYFIVCYGSLYVIQRNHDNYTGLFTLLFFASFLGFASANYLNALMFQNINGGKIIGISLGLTALVFFSLSAYALITKRNFKYLEGFLGIASIIIFALFIVRLFVFIPVLHLFTSGLVALVSSGMILYNTSSLIHEGNERNYILIATSLFINIFNLFISLLNILNFLSNSKD